MPVFVRPKPRKVASYQQFSAAEVHSLTSLSEEDLREFCRRNTTESAEAAPIFDDRYQGTVVDRSERDCLASSIEMNSENYLVYEAIMLIAEHANSDVFGFNYTHLEGLTLLHYQTGGFVVPHMDWAAEFSTRKFTVILQLSDPDTYEGGDLVLHLGEKRHLAPREFGSAICFPAFVFHSVTEVTRGSRRSLAGFFEGPPFA